MPTADLDPQERAGIIRDSLGVGIATGAYGISFGAVSVAAGLSVAQTCALSLLMFTGASQFAMVGVLAAGGPPASGVLTALLLGLTMAAASLVRAWSMGVGWDLGRVVAVTALCIVVWAGLVAAVLPLALRKLRLDPAVISAPLITTLVDGTGLVIYFTAAQWLLHLA